MTRRVRFLLAVAVCSLQASGCSGLQSALDPSGHEAREVSLLFWTVTSISVAVTVMIVLFTVAAMFGSASIRRRIATHGNIVAFGIALPVFVLSGLLAYGLLLMQAGQARSGLATRQVTIVGKQWWWRVVYDLPGGRQIVSANELRLPVGEPVALRLETEDVIHSFWAPKLGGKLDMVPGRKNVLTVEAEQAGISRAQCAEYCGGAHALMALYVVAMPPEDYASWLDREAAAATEPVTVSARAGRDVFFSYGCPACHTIRGTEASGVAGPDLTHVGGRHSLAAAALPNTAEAFAIWIKENQHVKPQNFMPEFDMLPEPDLAHLAEFLDKLE